MTLNKQDPGIEWTHIYGPGTGYTWNPVQGCQHDCKWHLPGEQIAECYAKSIAEKFRKPNFMPRGFAHHYWNPERLKEPLALKTPAGIFLDSFSDLMGHWIPDDQVNAVLDICRQADWHTFQLLTKSPKRLLQFTFPPNVWLGVSMPPDEMMGRALTFAQQYRYMMVANDVLQELRSEGYATFISFEPLSWDVAPYTDPAALSWAIIGAASRGATYYQPDPKHLEDLLRLLKAAGTPLFFKGNLKPSIPDGQWLEEFPQTVTPRQLTLFD